MSIVDKLKSFPGAKIKHVLAGALTVATMLVVYSLGMFVMPGPLTYLLSLIPLGIVATTAVVRANDIGQTKMSKRWHTRRLGLTLVAGAALAMMLGPLALYNAFPTWTDLLFYYGVALTWLTTPEMPPWWKWITRGDPKVLKND